MRLPEATVDTNGRVVIEFHDDNAGLRLSFPNAGAAVVTLHEAMRQIDAQQLQQMLAAGREAWPS